jgi:hypothetical protein
MSLQINIGVTPRREYLLEFILTHLDRVLDYCNMRHETIITLFAEDTSEIENREVLESLYDEIVYSENDPLHERFNDILSYNGSDSDWLLKLDMDSLLHPGFFDHYQNHKNSGVKFIGISRCYMLDTLMLSAKEVNNLDKPVGSFFLHRDLAGRILAEGGRKGSVYAQVKQKGQAAIIWAERPLLMDLKDGLNQWDYDQIGGFDFF